LESTIDFFVVVILDYHFYRYRYRYQLSLFVLSGIDYHNLFSVLSVIVIYCYCYQLAFFYYSYFYFSGTTWTSHITKPGRSVKFGDMLSICNIVQQKTKPSDFVFTIIVVMQICENLASADTSAY